MWHTKDLLDELNAAYVGAHVPYEAAYWASYMWDKSQDEVFVTSKEALDGFRSSRLHAQRVDEALVVESDPVLRERLQGWKLFFELFQIPDWLVALRSEITALEKKVESARSTRTYGYVDPYTHEYIEATPQKMRSMMRTQDDEKIRKALFDWVHETIADDVDDLITLVCLRNQYAHALGYKHFYDYKAWIEEKMTGQEIWQLFDELYAHADGSFAYVRELEKNQPGLREPWNYAYMMSGDFVKQEDPYLQLQDMLLRRGQSFAWLGVDFRGATLQLDLLERHGKSNNGFCHMPVPVWYKDGQRVSGQINFTCTAMPGQIGDGMNAGNTLFHEWGHAAHFAHMDMQDVIFNTEYPPASTAWAETQSQFMDTMFSSIDRKMRYAKNTQGEPYPWSIFEAKVKKFQPLAHRNMMGIMAVVNFERILYQTPVEQLTRAFVIQTAREISDKYLDYTTPDLFVLMPVHIYSWESACSYHGYGIADLAVDQWRTYRYEKDGYIVDNPAIGPAMAEVWKRWSAKSLQELVALATGKKLSADAYIQIASRSVEETLAVGRARCQKLSSVAVRTWPIDLDAHISLVHGDHKIADNGQWFEQMCERFGAYLQKLTGT